MDTSTMLATLAIVKTLPETSTAEAVAAANRAEAAAEAVEEELEGGMANVIMSQSTQPDDNLNKIWFDTSADAEITVPELSDLNILVAPNGTRYRLLVSNDGTLSTEEIIDEGD